MYRALIVEDDPDIAELIAERARMWDIECRAVEDLQNVMGEFARYRPHIVLLDIGLPGPSGCHWCGEIRKVSKVPVVFISAASDNMNIVMAMGLGGDDFIAKPFDSAVLIAKMRALLRRTYDFAAAVSLLEHRGAFLDTGDGTLTYNGESVPLTKNEYRILLCLMENKGRVVSRERLMERLWKTHEFVDENTLTVNINRLRRKLDAAGLSDFITTKVGAGYLVE